MLLFGVLACLVGSCSAVFQLSRIGYLSLPDCAGTSSFNRDAIRKAAYDPVNKHLYVTGLNCIRVLSLQSGTPTLLYTKSNFFGEDDGEINDIAFCNDTVAITVEHHTYTQSGFVLLFSPYNAASNSMDLFSSNARVTVGSRPKSLAITSDCNKIVVTNEGVPGLNGPVDSTNTVFEDPAGTISVIIRDDTAGSAPLVRTVGFTQYDPVSQRPAGVRYIYRGEHPNGYINTFSDDLEPEDVVISTDDRYAYVSFHENNGLARMDLFDSDKLEMIVSGGIASWSTNSLDPSNTADGGANLKSFNNLFSLNQPSALAYGEIGTGNRFLITANQGGSKVMTQQSHGKTFSDTIRVRLGYNDGIFDTALMDADTASALNQDSLLGRLHISTIDGKDPDYGTITDLYAFGGRSASMWNATSMTKLFDTGDDFETIAANVSYGYRGVFNGDCSAASKSPEAEKDTRSDDMGPEPSAVTVGLHTGSPFSVIGTRNGLLYVYGLGADGSPSFESVFRGGLTSSTWNTLYSNANGDAGDGIISDMGYIPENSITSYTDPFIYVIGRATGSVALYRVQSMT